MDTKTIGSLEIIGGERNSKVPYSSALVVKGNEGSALIDCGVGKEGFTYIHSHYEIQDLLLTHYHLDHTWGAYQFPEANIKVNPLDLKKLKDYEELAKANGLYSVIGKERAVKQIMEEGTKERSYNNIIGLLEHTYELNHRFQLAGQTVEMLHAPGHCESFCCPYFPNEGVLLVGDYDLTSFGPWYNNADSDIDDFLSSGEMTLDVDAEYFVTSHHKGMFTRKEYETRLRDYLAIIHKREEKMLRLLREGISPKSLIEQEIFYFQKHINSAPDLRRSEILGVAKHLERATKQNHHYVDYYETFLETHFAAPAFSNYFTEDSSKTIRNDFP